jgi:hypothetical protein
MSGNNIRPFSNPNNNFRKSPMDQFSGNFLEKLAVKSQKENPKIIQKPENNKIQQKSENKNPQKQMEKENYQKQEQYSVSLPTYYESEAMIGIPPNATIKGPFFDEVVQDWYDPRFVETVTPRLTDLQMKLSTLEPEKPATFDNMLGATLIKIVKCTKPILKSLIATEAKSRLNELAQKERLYEHHYVVVSTEGPPHMTKFNVDLIVARVGRFRSSAYTKGEAEANAARKFFACVSTALSTLKPQIIEPWIEDKRDQDPLQFWECDDIFNYWKCCNCKACNVFPASGGTTVCAGCGAEVSSHSTERISIEKIPVRVLIPSDRRESGIDEIYRPGSTVRRWMPMFGLLKRDYVKDLTTECIEANPGPQTTSLKAVAKTNHKLGMTEAQRKHEERKRKEKIAAKKRGEVKAHHVGVNLQTQKAHKAPKVAEHKLKKEIKIAHKIVHEAMHERRPDRHEKSHKAEHKSHKNPIQLQRHAIVANCVSTVCAPGDVRLPERFSNLFADTETALTSLTTSYPIRMPKASNTQTNFQLPLSSSLIVTFRNDARHAVVYDANPDALDAIYNFYFSNVNNSNVTYSAPVDNMSLVYVPESGAVPLVIAYATPDASTQYSPHGDIWPAGRVQGSKQTAFWMDKWNGTHGSTLTLSISDTTNANGGDLLLNKYDDNGFLLGFASVPFTSDSGTYTFRPTVSGYYAFSYRVDVTDSSMGNAVLTNCTLQLVTDSSTFCHITVKAYSAHMLNYTSARITGHSMLLSNGTAVLEKEGYVSAVQSAVGFEWSNYIQMNYSDFSTQANCNKMTFVKGAYAFAKPADENDFVFREAHNKVGFAIQGSYFYLDQNTPVLAMMIKVDDYTELNSIVYTSATVEMQTKDPWMGPKMPLATNSEWIEAFQLVKKMPFMYQNETHLEKIGNFLKNTLAAAPAFIRKWGPIAADAIAMFV